MACSMLVSYGSKTSVNNTVQYLEKITSSYIKEISKGGFPLHGYRPLPPLKENAPIAPPDLTFFHHTFPVVDRRVLEVRETAWQAFAVGGCLGDRPSEWLKQHNQEFNPSGNFYKENNKRPAETEPEEAKATVISKWEAGDPETREDAKTKYGGDWQERAGPATYLFCKMRRPVPGSGARGNGRKEEEGGGDEEEGPFPTISGGPADWHPRRARGAGAWQQGVPVRGNERRRCLDVRASMPTWRRPLA